MIRAGNDSLSSSNSLSAPGNTKYLPINSSCTTMITPTASLLSSDLNPGKTRHWIVSGEQPFVQVINSRPFNGQNFHVHRHPLPRVHHCPRPQVSPFRPPLQQITEQQRSNPLQSFFPSCPILSSTPPNHWTPSMSPMSSDNFLLRTILVNESLLDTSSVSLKEPSVSFYRSPSLGRNWPRRAKRAIERCGHGPIRQKVSWPWKASVHEKVRRDSQARVVTSRKYCCRLQRQYLSDENNGCSDTGQNRSSSLRCAKTIDQPSSCAQRMRLESESHTSSNRSL